MSHKDCEGVIISQALNAFKAAYANFPVRVELASERATFGGDVQFDQDHIAYVNADQAPLNQLPMPCADTNPFSTSTSRVYYLPNLAQAQIALGSLVNNNWQPLSPMYPPQGQIQQNAFLNVLQSAGRGIGNNAAHEIGHQLHLPYMDCDKPGNPNCPGNDPHYFHYEYFSCSGYPPAQSDSPGQALYLNVGSPMHWGDPTAAALQQKLLEKYNMQVTMRYQSKVEWLSEMLLSVNLGLGVAIALRAYISQFPAGRNVVADILLRAIVTVNHMSGLASNDPRGACVAFVAMIATCVLCCALLVHALRSCVMSGQTRWWLGLLAALAPPMCWLYVARTTFRLTSYLGGKWLLLIGILVAGIVTYACTRWRIRTWGAMALLFVYFSFWAWMFFQVFPQDLIPVIYPAIGFASTVIVVCGKARTMPRFDLSH